MMISIASATINESLYDLSARQCQVMDFGKVDTTAFNGVFNINSSTADCVILADYAPFENKTKEVLFSDSIDFYGTITESFSFNNLTAPSIELPATKLVLEA